jgi:hypothetical protein
MRATVCGRADRDIFDVMPTVSRRDRLTDLAALLLILAGVAIGLHAGMRLGGIAKLSYRHPGPQGQSALAAADRARYESYVGVGVAILGCIVGVTSAVLHARRRSVS